MKLSQVVLILIMLLIARLPSVLPLVLHRNIPLQMANVPMALVFFSMGNFWGLRVRQGLIRRYAVGGVALAGGIWVAVSLFCGKSNMANAEFYSASAFCAAACGGIVVVMYISQYLQRLRMLSWIGRHSLIFFLIEWVLIKIVTDSLRGLGVDIPKSMLYDGASILWTMVVFICVLALQCFVAPILEFGLNYLRRLLCKI